MATVFWRGAAHPLEISEFLGEEAGSLRGAFGAFSGWIRRQRYRLRVRRLLGPGRLPLGHGGWLWKLPDWPKGLGRSLIYIGR